MAVCFVVILFAAFRAHRELNECEAFCEAAGASMKTFVPSRWNPARCACE